MTDDVDAQLEELREEEGRGNKLERDSDQAQRTFIDELVESLEAVDDGEVNATLSFHDKNLAGLFAALEADEQRKADVARALGEALDRDIDPEDTSRSELLKLAIRAGLQDVDPELLSEARDASNRRKTDQF